MPFLTAIKDVNGAVQAQLNTPVGDLEWVVISGDGKTNDLKSPPQQEYCATVVLSKEQAQPFIDELEALWTEHKPKGKKLRSLGYYAHKVPTGEKDEDGQNVYEETGNIAITLKTVTTFPDGKEKVIKTFNSKGNEVALGDKLIGNGSRGRLKGLARMWTQPREAGISLYLNAVQLSKFVEYTSGPSFDELEDEDGDSFEGLDSDTSASAIADEQSGTSAGVPRL